MKEEKNKKVVNSKPKSSTKKGTTTSKKSTTVKKEVKKTVAKPAAKKAEPKKVVKSVASKKTVEKKTVAPKKVVKKVAEPKKTVAKKMVAKVETKKVETPKKVVKKATPEVKKVSKVAVKSVAKPAAKKVEVKKTVVKPVTKKTESKKAAPVKKEVKPKKNINVSENVNKQEVKVDTIDYKRYLYFVALILVSFILIISIWDITTYFRFNKLNTSYLVSTSVIDRSNQLKLEDASKTFSKLNGNYFVYVSYTNDDQIYNLEKKIKSVVKKYKIDKRFYYINVSNIIDSPDYINKINTYLGLRDAKISKVPTIYYVNKDNEVIYSNIISKTNGVFDVGDFQKLLDVNGFTAK